MTSKTFIVALALLLSATSATLAKSPRHSGTYFDYSGGSSSGGGGSGYDPGAGTQR